MSGEDSLERLNLVWYSDKRPDCVRALRTTRSSWWRRGAFGPAMLRFVVNQVIARHSKLDRPMSASGQKRHFDPFGPMSALTPLATGIATCRPVAKRQFRPRCVALRPNPPTDFHWNV